MMCSTLVSILALAGAQAPAPANVVKVYDLSPALPGGPPGEVGQPLLPYLMRGAGSEELEWDPAFGTDSLIDLLRNLAGDEFDYEGRLIMEDGMGHLIVQAPPAVQAMTERYLSFLEGVFGATTEIVIDALDWQAGSGEPETPVLIPMGDVDKLLARAGAGGRRTWRLQVHAGKIATLDLTRTTSLVTDYDVEIAQATGIADPIVEEVAVGTRIVASAAPAPGGTWLALCLRRGDPLSEIQEQDVALQVAITTQERIVSYDTARTYQNIDVLNRSLALSTFLPEGKALAIRSSVFAADKAHGETLLVRRGAGALPTFAQGSVDSKSAGRGADVLFVNGQSAVPPRCEISASLTSEALGGWPMIRHAEMGPAVHATIGIGSLDTLREIVRSVDDTLTVRDVGACLFLTHEDDTGEGAEASKNRQADGMMETIASLAPPARLAQVVVTLRRAGGGAGGGTEIAKCALPLRDGEPATFVLGAEGIEVADLEVEVAQEAALADPVMRTAFDGVAMWLKPSFTLSGDLTVELLARAHVKAGPAREFDLRASGLGKLDQSTHDQLFVREKLLFRKAEGSPRMFLLGESGGAGSKGALALQVEATEVK